MNIRTATESDWAEIINIYNHAVDEKFCTADTKHVTVESRLSWLKEHSENQYPIFVYEDENKILGWCSLSPYRTGRNALKTVAEISYYIHKDFRRKGIGSKLVLHTIEKAKQIGFKNLLAILLDKNNTSIYLLEKFGFKKWGHFPDIAHFENDICGQFIYGRKI